MTTQRGTGWLARQEAAKAALAARAGGAHPVYDNDAERARQAMYAEKAAADRAHAEDVERKRAVTVCRCPTCDGEGHVLLPRAAAMVEALARYDFVGWRPSTETITKLLTLAFEIDGAGKRIAQDVENTAAQVDAAMRKTTRRHVSPPHLDND